MQVAQPALIQPQRQGNLAFVIPSSASITALIVRPTHKVHLGVELRKESTPVERRKVRPDNQHRGKAGQGYKVIPKGDDVRFWNNQILAEIDNVIHVMLHEIEHGGI